MNEAIKKINSIFKEFNDTFEISANIIKKNDEDIVDGFKITGLKSDGSNFINELYSMFNDVITSISNEHEVIYEPEKGLIVGKKIVKVEYICEDQSPSNVS